MMFKLAPKNKATKYRADAIKWYLDSRSLFGNVRSAVISAIAEFLANQDGLTLYKWRVSSILNKQKGQLGGNNMRKLYKTTIVIWSEYDPSNVELNFLAQEAMDGAVYCSEQRSEEVKNPEADPDWDRTEFFDTDDEDGDSES